MDPQNILETSEDRRMVRQALARLSTKPATVLVLRASGLSYAEVAQALGVGIGQIGTLLRRAEAALRKEVTRGTSI
jgi:RNA polymerase sigma-70 factor (ECF subfamily)